MHRTFQYAHMQYACHTAQQHQRAGLCFLHVLCTGAGHAESCWYGSVAGLCGLGIAYLNLSKCTAMCAATCLPCTTHSKLIHNMCRLHILTGNLQDELPD